MVRVLVYLLVLFVFSLGNEMKLIRIKKDVYMVRGLDALPSVENRGFISNAYAVLTKEGWVVIDALSTPELSKEFIQRLQKVKKLPVRYIIVTHYHPDHYFGTKTYRDIGAKLIAHKKILEMYDSGELNSYINTIKERFPKLYDSVVVVKPDLVVDTETILKVGQKTFLIRAVAPAHTNNDIVIYMPEDKILFAGDLVYEKRIPFMGDAGANSKNWEKVLKKLKSLDAQVILGGHNMPMDKSAIDYTLGYITYLRENIKKLKEKGMFLDEIKQTLKESPYKNHVMYDTFHNANVSKVYMELDLEE